MRRSRRVGTVTSPRPHRSGFNKDACTMNTATLTTPRHATPDSASAAAAAPQPPRMDLYTTIHKALRHFMADTLVRVGAMDIDDAHDRHDTLQQLNALLAMLRSHVAHENQFIHAAVEQQRPGALQRISDDHDLHLATIEELEAQAQALPEAHDRDGAALRLYRQLALFVAENLEHMHVEESSNHALLWALFSDGELVALHDRLLASVPMPVMAVAWRWMAGALNLKDLAGMLVAMQCGMPGEAFQGVLALMRPHMGARRWGRLAAQLELASLSAPCPAALA
jgi:Hemerythrin HHE cation binding domain